jgi:hypothetical protein
MAGKLSEGGEATHVTESPEKDLDRDPGSAAEMLTQLPGFILCRRRPGEALVLLGTHSCAGWSQDGSAPWRMHRSQQEAAGC